MEVSQIPIKINQTNNVDGGKQKMSAQADGTPSFSGRILAIVNLLNQSKEDGKQPASQNSVTDGNLPADTKVHSDGDIAELSSILAALAAAIQTGKPLQESLQELIPSQNNQPDKADISAVLSSLAQKLEGTIQQSPQSDNQQIINLKQLIGDLQTELQNEKGLPDGLDEKIKKILDEVKTINTDQADAAPSGTLKNSDNTDQTKMVQSGNLKNSDNTDHIKMTPFGTLKNSDNVPASISKLSLDKNEVVIPVLPAQRVAVRGQNNSDKNPAIPQNVDQIRQEGIVLTANQPVQPAGGITAPKTSSPVLAVSDFVPEVSEWMDRFISKTNGQTGSSEAKFSLYPEHLGPMEIKITSQQGEVSAQIVTGTTMAKEALEGQLPQLREALLQHGLQVQKLDIVQQPATSMPQPGLAFSQGGYQPPREQKQFQTAKGGSKKTEMDDQNNLESTVTAISYSGVTPNHSSSIDFNA